MLQVHVTALDKAQAASFSTRTCGGASDGAALGIPRVRDQAASETGLGRRGGRRSGAAVIAEDVVAETRPRPRADTSTLRDGAINDAVRRIARRNNAARRPSPQSPPATSACSAFSSLRPGAAPERHGEGNLT